MKPDDKNAEEVEGCDEKKEKVKWKLTTEKADREQQTSRAWKCMPQLPIHWSRQQANGEEEIPFYLSLSLFHTSQRIFV